jgi:hypothetical protein
LDTWTSGQKEKVGHKNGRDIKATIMADPEKFVQRMIQGQHENANELAELLNQNFGTDAPPDYESSIYNF